MPPVYACLAATGVDLYIEDNGGGLWDAYQTTPVFFWLQNTYTQPYLPLPCQVGEPNLVIACWLTVAYFNPADMFKRCFMLP